MDTSSQNDALFRNFDKCKGQPWSSWITHISGNLNEGKSETVKDCRVTRLPRDDMGLFGLCPENDRFCAVVCSTCGAIVKKQGLQRHQELRHNSNTELILLPPPQAPAKKIKSSHMKVKNKESSVTVHSNESILTTSVFQSIVTSKPVDSSPNNTNPKLTSSKVVSVLTEPEPAVNSSRRKSPNLNSEQRKAQRSKEKEHVIEKESNDTEESRKSASTKVNYKIHSGPLKRTITFRTKDLNKLVAEHRAAKEQPPSLVPITSTTFLIHSHNKTKNNVPKTVNPPTPTECNFSVSSSTCSGMEKSFTTESTPPLLFHIATSQTSEGVTNSMNVNTHTSAVIFSAQRRPTICISKNINVDSEIVQTSQSLQIGSIIPTTIFNTPVIVLSPSKSPQVPPTVNLNVNSESTIFNNLPSTVSTEPSLTANKQEMATEAPRLPVLFQMPLLQDKNDIKVIQSFPKPLVVSNFGTKKVGGTVVYSNKRLDLIRTEFKTMLAKKGRISTVPLKSMNQGTASTSVYDGKLLNSTKYSKFSVVNNIHPPVVYTHRPNILRTSSTKQLKDQSMQKTIMVGLKNHSKYPALLEEVDNSLSSDSKDATVLYDLETMMPVDLK